jgi:superfamily I DNA/RNA helicase
MVAQVQARRKAWSKKTALAHEPQWSEYQQAIFDWVENGTGNLRVGACAGSGKSTMIAAIVARLPNDAKVQILAFNKHIVDGMKGFHSDGIPKLPTRVGVTTAHSMGNALLARCFEGVATVDSGKYRRIAKPLLAAVIEDLLNLTDWQETAMRLFREDMEGWSLGDNGIGQKEVDSLAESLRKGRGGTLRRLWMQFALALVRGCHSTLCDPNPEMLLKLIDYYGIEVPVRWEYSPQMLIPRIAEILDIGEEEARQKQIIDFGDMLWLPYKWELQPTAKDWLLIDETQDANRAQLHLYEKCGRYGRVIAVGDEDQAIQGFAFASPRMWGEIKTRFKAQSLPLSVCYRCPTSHLDLARYFVPTIEPSPTAKQGDVTVLHPDMVAGVVESGDLVLCRFTAPLVSTCIMLIIRGIPAKVRGREIGETLARLADVGAGNWANFKQVISQVMGDEADKLREQDKDDRADAVADNLECLLAIYDHFGEECQTLSKFLDKIESLFSDSASPVTLSTIHRSKGDEADNVFILACNVLPYRRDGMKVWQKKQEENLTYVALTRAKQSLVLVPTGRDDNATRQLTKLPFGGMTVEPVPFTPKPSPATIKPYPVGTQFSHLGISGYEVTQVIAAGESWEYKAKFTRKVGHWRSDTYSHSLVQNCNTLEIE